MARQKSFNEQDALEAATRCFWQEGYQGATFQRLEAATGLSGRSLINCFGDKDSLFAAALAHYRRTVSAELDAIEAKGSEAILALFRGIVDSPEHSLRHRGCLMINTIAEVAGARPEIYAEIDGFRQRLWDFFRESLKQADISGRKSKADFLLALLWGSSSYIRRKGSTRALQPVLKTLEECLKGWASQPKA